VVDVIDDGSDSEMEEKGTSLYLKEIEKIEKGKNENVVGGPEEIELHGRPDEMEIEQEKTEENEGYKKKENEPEEPINLT